MAINIVAAASSNYAMQADVLFTSVCANSVNEDVHFFLMVDKDFSNENKEKLKENIEKKWGQTLDYILIDDSLIENFLQYQSRLYSYHTFYRLLIAELLPQQITKAIYLDCDIIVRHSLSDLWNIDISDYAVAAVRDAQEAKIEQFNRLGYSYDKGYFNAGVLLANLNYWRQNKMTEKYFNLVKEKPEIIELNDQDILNYHCVDSKLFLPFTYNLQNDFMFLPKYMTIDYSKYGAEIEEARLDPVVLHFSGVRPWCKGCNHPYKDEYDRYKAMTVWRDEPLQPRFETTSQRIVRFLRPSLSRLGLCHVIPDRYDHTLRLKV